MSLLCLSLFHDFGVTRITSINPSVSPSSVMVPKLRPLPQVPELGFQALGYLSAADPT